MFYVEENTLPQNVVKDLYDAGQDISINGTNKRFNKILKVHEDVIRQLVKSKLDTIQDDFKKTFPKFNVESVSWEPELLLSINTPAPKGAPSVRGWHLDRGDKLYAGMIYIEPTGDSSDYPTLITKDSKIVHGHSTLVYWANTPDSWHSVSERPPSNRNRVMINFYCNSPLWVHSYEKINGRDHQNPVDNYWLEENNND